MARSNPRALVVALLAGSSVAACNSIIGLSDFKKGECAGGGACLDEAGVVDAGADSGDGSAEAGRGSEPVSWPNWRMPNYEGAEGGTPPSLAVTDGSTVTDGITHLVWQASADTQLLAFQDAHDKCAKIAPAGTWRLPKRIELVTLLDFSKPSFVDPAFFKVPSGPVWTSSELRTVDDSKKVTVTSSFWIVNFHDGSVSASDGSSPAAVTLCVKAQ